MSMRARYAVLAVLSLMLLSLCLSPSGVCAGISEDGVEYTVDTGKGEASVTGLSHGTDVIIRESVSFEGRDYPVTMIAYGAFSGTGIERVSVPGSVELIGDSAFRGCASLEEVLLSEGLDMIADNAFGHCSSLKSVSIPDSVTSVGEGAFMFSGLRTLELPAHYVRLDGDCFSGTPLASVSVPDWMEKPGLQFRYCDGLTAFAASGDSYVSSGGVLFTSDMKTLVAYPSGSDPVYSAPDGLEEVGPGAFADNQRIREVSFGDGLKKVGSHAFRNCLSLTHVSLPDSVEEICDGAFRHSSVRLGGLPESLSKLGKMSFADCAFITEVRMPSSLTDIGDGAFRDCDGIRSITINSTLEYIGDRVFTVHVKYIGYPESLKRVGRMSFDADIAEFRSEVRHPYEVAGAYAIGLPPSAAINCEHAVNNVDSGGFAFVITGDGAKVAGFDGSYQWDTAAVPDSVVYDGRTYPVVSVGSLAFAGEASVRHVVPAGAAGELSPGTLMLPDSVVSVDARAFAGCPELVSVSLGSGVASVGEEAFRGCPSLRSAGLDAGKVSKEAFADCVRLSDLKLGPDVGYILQYAFRDCSVSELEFPSAAIADTAFTGNSFGKVVFGAGTGTDYLHTVLGCPIGEFVVGPGNPDLNVRDGVLFSSDGKTLLRAPSGISGTYTVPEGTETVGPCAFLDCVGLDDVVLPQSLREIQGEAFFGVTFHEITVPAKVQRVDPMAFYGMTVHALCDPSAVEWSMLMYDSSSSVRAENMIFGVSDGRLYLQGFVKGMESRNLAVPEAVRIGDLTVPVAGVMGFSFTGMDFDEVRIPASAEVGIMAFNGAFVDKVVVTGSFGGGSQAFGIPCMRFASEAAGLVSADGVLFADGGELAAFPALRTGSYEIPDGTLSIGPGAFGGRIHEVSIPQSVHWIGRDAFRGCENLHTVFMDCRDPVVGSYAFLVGHPFTVVSQDVVPGLIEDQDVTYAAEVSFRAEGAPGGFAIPPSYVARIGSDPVMPDPAQLQEMYPGYKVTSSYRGGAVGPGGLTVTYTFSEESSGMPLWILLIPILCVSCGLFFVVRRRRSAGM